MQVTVRLFATLRVYREKEMLLDLPEGSTSRSVIDRLNISEQDAAIIFINGRTAKLDQQLENDDTLSIFPAVGGG